MADKEYVDSGQPVRALAREVLDKIGALSPEIRAAAEAAHVGPMAVAGPMAREMNKRVVGDYGSQLQLDVFDTIREHNALFRTIPEGAYGPVDERYGHDDYVRDMKDTDSISLPPGRWARAALAMSHPVLNDVGLADIRLKGAIPALDFYLKHPERFKGLDPFGWEKYRNHYDSFAYDLAKSPTSDEMSVEASAANAAYINHEMAEHVANWYQLTPDQRAEYITAYSASGGKQFRELWNAPVLQSASSPAARQILLHPEELSKNDGAAYLVGPAGGASNLEKLRDVITPPSIPPFYARPEWLQDAPSEHHAPVIPSAFGGRKKGAAIEPYSKNVSNPLATLDYPNVLSQAPINPSGISQFALPGLGDLNAPWRGSADQQVGRPFGDFANWLDPSYASPYAVISGANKEPSFAQVSNGSNDAEGQAKARPFSALGLGATAAFQLPNAVVSPVAKAVAAAPPRTASANNAAATHITHRNEINMHLDGKTIAREVVPIVMSILGNDIVGLGAAMLDGYFNDQSAHHSPGG